MRIVFSILCLTLLVHCSSPKDNNKFKRIETGDYPLLPLGTTVDTLLHNYGVRIDTIVSNEPPRQTFKASRVLFDTVVSIMYLYFYSQELVSYTERFNCKDLLLTNNDSLLVKKLYNINEIDSLWKFGEKINSLLVRAGNDHYSTNIELPYFNKGCQGCVCRIFSSFNATRREDLIENF